MNLTIKEAKRNFFDRDPVERRLQKVRLAAYSKVGAFVQRDAKSSLKKARQKKIDELDPTELAWYRKQVAEWKKHGKVGDRPRRPRAYSRPGEPPRMVRGLIKQFLFFSYDRSTESVVIGPAKIETRGRNVPQVLEYGGRAETSRSHHSYHMAPRPFMRPALARVLHHLPGWLQSLASV